jgi:FkbM family methyltransferase
LEKLISVLKKNINKLIYLFKKLIIKIKGFFPVRLKTFFKKFKKFNGYNQLDVKLLKYINFKNGFYIDCGANDGVNQSTTWYFEKSLCWKGLLIEAIPEVFIQLKKNRGPKNFFENCALVSSKFKKGNAEFFYNKKDTLTGGTLRSDNSIKKIIPAKTLDSILKKNPTIKIIDLFSLDVEGNEFEVLGGTSLNKIRYILVETNNFKKLNNVLNAKEFKFVERLSNYNFLEQPDYGDYLFKNKLLD